MRTLATLLRISLLAVLVTVLFWAYATMAQTETGTISGLITDETGAAVPGAQVQLLSVQRGTTSDAKTNNAGIYVLSGVQPGMYQLKVQKAGFKQVDLLSLIVNVQDHIEQNVRLQIGSVSESVTVNANDVHMNTTDATVSTVVDRNFAENLPMNGRSFQTLIDLTPGVVVTPSSSSEPGQFSINGQRSASNYWMVDGVSANVGISSLGFPGEGASGAQGTTSALGGTNGLVSVDAMQEFRIQTSTYAPEFGRVPGGQISIVTRAGTNRVHGTLFDYFRNDALDANNWFADSANLPKPKERQNDFGGTFSGPIVKDRTFFFFSYEGLRLRLPQTVLTTVPDASFTPGGTTNSRQNPNHPEMQPFLNAYPLPNRNSPEIFQTVSCDAAADPNCSPSGTKQVATGYAAFNSSFSSPSSLNAVSLRLDHRISESLNAFVRYSYSPSELAQRAAAGDTPSASITTRVVSQTATAGITWNISPEAVNDFRFNYSRTASSGRYLLDTFGGAVPPSSLPFPSPFTVKDSFFFFQIQSLENAGFSLGKLQTNLQRQFNVIDNLSLQKHSHSLKFGIDYRRLSPHEDPLAYTQQVAFGDVPSAEAGALLFSDVGTSLPATFLIRNLGVFAEDTWRIVPRLTVTYGLRWDLDWVPVSTSGPSLPAVANFNPADLSQLVLAPVGTLPYHMTYGNLAPRVGAAYELLQHQDWNTVLRGGFGVFYDLASQQVGNSAFSGVYPFGSTRFPSDTTFPLSPSSVSPPAISPSDLLNNVFRGFDPNLELPYTFEWNLALEQGLGKQQTVSATYVGAAGRRLLMPEEQLFPNPNFELVDIVRNTGTSDYHALQIQFQRRLRRGLQILSSYSWAHSIDTGSAGSFSLTNSFAPNTNPNTNRGSSDFDIRHSLSAGLTYDVPCPWTNRFLTIPLRGWSLQSVVLASSAPPVDVLNTSLGVFSNNFTTVRPDIVPGVPFYIFDSALPAGREFNKAAFVNPPLDPNTHKPLRQGDLARNALRGFGATQWDFAIHREFPIGETVKLQFRAELFNVLNHPNFGQPSGNLALLNTFGKATTTLAQSLSGNGSAVGAGGLSPLYQIGGPRSTQLALKILF
jgi:hypothetical protein